MGTKRSIFNVREGTDESHPAPPGFGSLTSFTLTSPPRTANSVPKLICSPLRDSDIAKMKASFWNIQLDGQSDSLERELDNKLTEVLKNHAATSSLPKGVIRGCPDCPDCVKVTAKWRPDNSRLPELEDAPVFYPTEEEFKDTLEYIAKIRPQAENFGICRIVPPSSWKLPGPTEKMWDNSKFSTCVQRIDELQDCGVDKLPVVCSQIGPDFTLETFSKYANDFKQQYFRKNDTAVYSKTKPLTSKIEGEYWRMIENPTEEIEVLLGGNSTCQSLGSGFPTRKSPSEILPYSEYVESGWNLNNTAKLPGSLLQYETSKTIAPQVSVGMCFASQCWMLENHHLYSLSYMHLGDSRVWYGIPGMYCFKFMKVARKLFPELSNHPELLQKLVTQISPAKLMAEGIPVYRCVQNASEFVLTLPSAYHSEFSCGFNCSESVCFAPFDWLPHGQDAVELYIADCQKTSISHDKLLLRAAIGAVHAQWEFVSGESSSIAGPLWSSACRKDGILTKALKVRVKLESIRREYLCKVPLPKTPDEFDSSTKMECSICQYDLYLSAVSCSRPSCSPNRYACPLHAKKLCSCSWGDKRFFFRYTIAELYLLVEALETNNLMALRSWAMKGQPPSGLSIEKTAVLDRINKESDEAVRQLVARLDEEKAKIAPNQNVVLVSDNEDA